jgi:hypothetical protein
MSAAEEWINPPAAVPTVRLGEIAAAFAKAQLEMKNPGFDATNPFYKSKFASLAAVRNAVVPLLAKHNICMAQDLTTGEGTISCATILTHASGQQMRFGPLTLPVGKEDAQGYAAAGTYAKRISLQSVCGVVGDEDDDGNSQVKPNGAHTDAHSPADDIPEDEARAEAVKMIAILNLDVDHKVKALKVLDFHDIINKNQALYEAASKQMKPDQRATWKEYRKEAKLAEKEDRAVSNVGKRF